MFCGSDSMFDKNYNYTPINAFKQHWSQASFSYLETPRPDYGLMLVLNGQIDFISPHADTLCAKAGNIILLPKNSYYKAKFRIDFGEIDNYLINFKSNMDFLCTKPMLITQNASYICRDLFNEFIDEFYNIKSMNLRSKGLFYLLLDSILNQKEPQKSPSDKTLDKAMNLIKQNIDMPISQIAQECSVSESGLRKIFNDKISTSPTQFKLKEKLHKAKYLLESTDLSVSEITDKLNFYDSAHFCKLFRKNIGLSPKQYRQNKKL